MWFHFVDGTGRAINYNANLVESWEGMRRVPVVRRGGLGLNTCSVAWVRLMLGRPHKLGELT